MAELKDFLRESAQTIGITLQVNQIEKFIFYLGELKKWNKKTNLTRIETDKDIIVKHFIDSLACWPMLPPPPTSATLIDVGTGAGFPGIPIKIYNDKISLSLLETTNKKVTFLEYICRKLSFEQTEVICGRAEEIAYLEKYREQFDIVVSRALAKMNVLVELCLPFAKIGGEVIIYKGTEIKDEVDKANKAITILGGQIENIKELSLFNMKRTFVILRKINDTPISYPRRPGIPNKRPL